MIGLDSNLTKRFGKNKGWTICPAVMENCDYVFEFGNHSRYTGYYFNMLKPEVYAIDCDPPYIPLSSEDIDILMDILINENAWNEIIDFYKEWIVSSDGCPDTRFYTTIDPIPLTPPDYHLIWQNGYTGKEDISMILHEDT